ncbi:hypothetical protein GV68_25395 [Pseudorhizobium pelagicum]|uniref:Helix-turn-helix domain-containing protein n=2 Tax=Pseudorhizobium pelagicum TaxID=1509405 RepID=A0A922P0C2_9HYPH|nr:hypothetical protein GV68_25395 [Pseudorhizobium pelagicum]
MRHAPVQSYANREEAPNLRAMPADALLSRRELSALSGYAIITLKIWAANNRGPRITRVEGRPRYRVEDVREWIGLSPSAKPEFTQGIFA